MLWLEIVNRPYQNQINTHFIVDGLLLVATIAQSILWIHLLNLLIASIYCLWSKS